MQSAVSCLLGAIILQDVLFCNRWGRNNKKFTEMLRNDRENLLQLVTAQRQYKICCCAHTGIGVKKMTEEEKKPEYWVIADPKPPVIRSGHMENRKK
jgi:hypothetical protein